MKFNPMHDGGLRFKHFHGAISDQDFEFYSIGDVHGCAEEYVLISEKIIQDAASRKKIAIVFQHGDMIDRGPKFVEIFNTANYYSHICILGNHEHNFVLERIGKPCNSNSRKVSHDKFEALSEKTQKKVMKFFNNLYNFGVVEIGDRTFVLTHAPLKNMEEYTDWRPYLYTGNAPFFCMRSSVPIDEDMEKLQKEVTFVYGHQSWEYKDIEVQKNEQAGRKSQYYNIDGSCVYGGQLVALRLSDLGVLRVDSGVKVDK